MEHITQFARQHWNKSFRSIKELRNAEKLIYVLVDELGVSYVLKGEKENVQSVEENCQFANDLRAILPISMYFKTIQNTFTTQYGAYVFTLAEYLSEGEEISSLTDIHLKEIATKLAIMHRYTLTNELTLQKATSWSMFGGNETEEIGDYDENELSFQLFEKTFHQHPKISSIKEKYRELRGLLYQAWPSLPKVATQGDFCYYNMRFKEGKLVALFDFDLAGDEVLVNEFVAVAIYLSWHVPYEGSLTSQERYQLFVQQYEKERPLAMEERNVLPALFSIIRAFRYDRVEDGVADMGNVEQFLQETWKLLNT